MPKCQQTCVVCLGCLQAGGHVVDHAAQLLLVSDTGLGFRVWIGLAYNVQMSMFGTSWHYVF